jgi:tRNA A37 N6-isopentenylltransferase MiaA
MERLAITARLKVPIILGGGYLTLDALLASLNFEQSGDIEIAHNTIPLASTDGLFHASAALLARIIHGGRRF